MQKPAGQIASRWSASRLRERIRPVFAALLLLLLLGSGTTAACCGSGGEEAGPAPDYARDLAGSPAPLAALHRDQDRLIHGGVKAFRKRMAALKGYPAVVNLWASWCGPCRAEFPHFQTAAAAMGRKVAFLAVNPDDDADAAATFLESHPVPYPSFFDPDRKIVESLGVPRMIPATVFFDRSGKQTYTKYGGYPDQAALEADIRAHATAR